MSENKDFTISYNVNLEQSQKIDDILVEVCQALQEKGYNPVNQLVGYIMSGDPTYITSHNNARQLIRKIERDELLEEVVRRYLSTISEK
jgi:uncharacterized protein (UPF0297 family)